MNLRSNTNVELRQRNWDGNLRGRKKWGEYLFFSSSSFLSLSMEFLRSVDAGLGLELGDLGEGDKEKDLLLRRRRLRGVGERLLRRR